MGNLIFPSQGLHPVCTTELGYVAGLQPEFAKRNCKIIGLSLDPVSDYRNWVADIEETQGSQGELSDDRRSGAQDSPALQHAVGQERQHFAGPHAGG